MQADIVLDWKDGKMVGLEVLATVSGRGTATPPTWSAGACRSRWSRGCFTHQSSTTTSQAYVHLDVADIRQALRMAGAWQEEAR